MKAMKLAGVAKGMLSGALLLASLAWGSGAAFAAHGTPGAVYVETNAASGNAIAVFDRGADGTLTAAATVATGGLGSGAGLGSQGALALSENDRWLFAVNAGSNDISVLAVTDDGLSLVSRTAVGGAMPISLTVDHDLLYVLNAGSSTITGFRVGAHGDLSPLSGSTQPLSGSNVGPAQVSFSPDGRWLVVAEKNTNLIDTYAVGHDGRAGAPTFHASAGNTPFGFAFAGRETLVVSDAGSSAVSSYTVSKHGGFAVATPLAPTHLAAPCWVAASDNGRYAYTTNAGSGVISGYRVAHDGTLSELNADGRTGVIGAGSHPIDLGFSRGSRYLYALTTGSPLGIAAFAVGADGSLTSVGGVGGTPASAAGLVAR